MRKSATTCFNQRTGTTHSVSAGSLFALAPVLSRRRRLLAVESNAFADYQRTRKKGESQRIKIPYRRFEAVYARPMYAPVRVSTRMVSPSLMKSGTWIVLPVSSFAGF
jgi:hypothetical protein